MGSRWMRLTLGQRRLSRRTAMESVQFIIHRLLYAKRKRAAEWDCYADGENKRTLTLRHERARWTWGQEPCEGRLGAGKHGASPGWNGACLFQVTSRLPNPRWLWPWQTEPAYFSPLHSAPSLLGQSLGRTLPWTRFRRAWEFLGTQNLKQTLLPTWQTSLQR